MTDVLAGLLGGVAVIGYANKPGKAETLARAGARAVVTDLAEITTALRTAPSPALPNGAVFRSRAARCTRRGPALAVGLCLGRPGRCAPAPGAGGH